MHGKSTILNPERVRFEVGRPEDLAATLLAFKSPDSLMQDSWTMLAIADGEDSEDVIGVVRVGRMYHGIDEPKIIMQFGIIPSWFDTDIPSQLVRQTLTNISEWGASSVQIFQHLAPSKPLSKILKEEGFQVQETFDTFEADLQPLVTSWHENNERFARYFKDLPDTEVMEITEDNIRAVAKAWSSWIGGTAEENYDVLMHALGGNSERITLRHSCVLISEGQLIGIGLGHVSDQKLTIHALAIAPSARVAGLTPRILARMGSIAVEDGASVMKFEAGRRQPDTQRVARRIQAKLTQSNESLVYTFVD